MTDPALPYFVTYAIIAVTVLVSYLGFQNPQLFHSLKHDPYAERQRGEYYRLLTSGFLHGSWWHLGVNMFVLFFFGRYAEAEVCGYGAINAFSFGPTAGPFVYLALYMLTVVIANLGTFFRYGSQPGYSAIGASGAVSGATTLFGIFLPWENIYLYGIIAIPAIVAAVGFVVYSQYASKHNDDGIDHSAHLYGALAMPALYFALKPALAAHFVGALVNNFPF